MIQKLESVLEWGGIKKDILFLVISGVFLICSIFHLLPLPFDAAWVAILLCGIPILSEAVIGLVTEFDITADVLVAIALIASVCIGEDFAAGEVAFIMQLGGLLEALTVARARAGIENLVHLTPRTARIVIGSTEKEIPAEKVSVGDILRVLPGETVPVDGVITEGRTSVNQAVMTGESLPVDKDFGDDVQSGTVNQFGAFEMRAEKVGEDSSIQRMIRLVQSADADKAKIVRMADRWAVWVVLIAISAAVLTFLVTHEIIRSVTILVVFCPCSLVLATPTAIMAAIGNATKHGFLVREGDALERLSSVKRVTFDKTGTLTYGQPDVSCIKNYLNSLSENELLQSVANAELLSEHPLGKAIVRKAKQDENMALEKPDSFEMIPGRGVMAELSGKEILAGNKELLLENGITFSEQSRTDSERYLSQGSTIIWVALGNKLAGFIALSDTIREDAADVIRGITEAGAMPVLLTGDHKNAADEIAGQLGIREIRSECTPADKLDYIALSEKKKFPVCMIGDGINDAPALKRAFVGIAMGGIGSDIAVDAADIALVNDEIRELPHLFWLSRHMMRVIRANLTFSMTLNFIAIALAVTGVLNPVIGALVHNAGSVVVIVNSAFLLKWRKKK